MPQGRGAAASSPPPNPASFIIPRSPLPPSASFATLCTLTVLVKFRSRLTAVQVEGAASRIISSKSSISALPAKELALASDMPAASSRRIPRIMCRNRASDVFRILAPRNFLRCVTRPLQFRRDGLKQGLGNTNWARPGSCSKLRVMHTRITGLRRQPARIPADLRARPPHPWTSC